MRKVNLLETLKIITKIILLMSICIKVSAQSPYAMFGDNSKMLDAKNESVPSIYRVGVQSANGVNLYADFDMNKGLATLYDTEGKVLRQDSISTNAKAMFLSIDPLAEKYYHISPYVYCAGNPVNAIDPDGCDSIHVNYIDNMWHAEEPVLSKGDDVFIINDGNKTSTITYNEGEYGNRVCALNLDVNDNYTLGIYYVSGAGKKGCGFYVTPGGEASSQVGSGARIPEGNYPILAPNGGNWQQPQVGGIVAPRGIRFHYGYPSPRNWTEGCFVLSHDYYIDNGKIQFDKQSSLNALQNFDHALGGGDFYKYSFVNSRGKVQTRFGAKFENPIQNKLYLRSR